MILKRRAAILIFITHLIVFSRSLKFYEHPQISDSLHQQTKQSFQPYHENRVHRAGQLWMNTTNTGTFGRLRGDRDQCTGRIAPRAEMPGGSGIEYIYNSSLWLGGYLDSAAVDIDGNPAAVFQGPLVSTAYDSSYMFYEELQPYYFDEDPTGISLGRIEEISNVEGRLNCLFEEVYDPNATAYEQFIARYTDKGTNHFTWCPFENRQHIPLGIEVKQVSYAWPYDFAKKFIIVDYTFYNRNKDKKDIYNFFAGIYVSSAVTNTNVALNAGDLDDICGYIDKWDGYIDPATGEHKTVNMNMLWIADNDGREYISDADDIFSIDHEPGAGSPLDGATGVFTIRVLRNPNPNMRYSFNLWTPNWFDESLDWGPRWQTGLHPRPPEDHPEPLPHELRDDPRAVPWIYDLTMTQKGYDDTNYDDIAWDIGGGHYMIGGRTEGTPAGDKGRYMVMSNDEFDYNLTSIREVYLGMDTQADGTPIPQADKWQRYTTPETLGQPGFADDIIDGYISDLNDIANGLAPRYVLSFGPLGFESYVNVAWDPDDEGNPQSVIPNKKVWKFAYGDSLKLTLAYMVSEHFHTSLEQDPNYRDSTVVDLTDGLDVSLYDQGWYDAFYNVVWAERVYDTPMYDTPVTRFGITRGDGWYGEDNLLPFGRLYESDCGKYGPTGNPEDGEGWGYMVKYDKLDGYFPQGTWVRYGFDDGRLTAGDGVPDFRAPSAPPSPKIEVSAVNTDIIIEWTSHEFYYGDDGEISGVAGPEFTYNRFTRLYDFEGYNIEISPDRRLENFTTLFGVDRVNYIYQNVSDLNDYLDNPIPADTIAAYPDRYPALTALHGRIYHLVPFGDNRDLEESHSVEGVFTYTCVSAISPYPEWGDIRYYRFILHNQTPGEKKYIAVTSTGYGAPKMGVPPMKSPPSVNAYSTVSSKLTTTGDVVVVPNPYRADADYSRSGWEDPDGSFSYAEEYRRIAFLNIPDRCVIRIYTLAGDLVKVIAHNGNAGHDTPYWHGKNGAYWNLITDNQQAAVSGIYLFSVQDVDNRKDDFVGKFVIIK